MGYEYFTTFWQDFDIAEAYGEQAIRDTAKRAFEEWKDDVKYLTELVMIINHKCWDFYRKGVDTMTELYGDIYYEYHEKALDYLEAKGNEEDIRYYIRTLD